MKGDINDMQDVQLMVNSFYEAVRKNNLIGPIFNAKIPQGAWPQHLDKMYRFWYTILFDEVLYKGTPFPPHAQLPIAKEHFDEWIALFCKTVEEHFTGPKAEEAKLRAMKMAQLFQVKLAAIGRGMKPLI